MRSLSGMKKQGGWVNIAIAAFSLASSLYAGSKKKKAAKAEEEARGQQAADRLAEMDETLRRTAMEQDRVLGSNVASVGASGIRMSGSAARVQKATEAEFTRQAQWIKKSGESEASAIRTGASITRKAQETQAKTGVAQGMITAAQIGGWT